MSTKFSITLKQVKLVTQPSKYNVIHQWKIFLSGGEAPQSDTCEKSESLSSPVAIESFISVVGNWSFGMGSLIEDRRPNSLGWLDEDEDKS